MTASNPGKAAAIRQGRVGRLRKLRKIIATACHLIVFVGSPAIAHTGNPNADFVGGFTHPLFGPDHIVAMLGVGLWGAFLGQPAIFVLPIVFPIIMACGGIIGILGVHVPAVEIGIALSAIVIGTMVAMAARPPLALAAVLVGMFAIFHGYAHGAELPLGANALSYFLGFVVATGMLHLAGISFGLLARWPAGQIAVRAAGGAIALAGVVFLL
jgi:urease accessory protein